LEVVNDKDNRNKILLKNLKSVLKNNKGSSFPMIVAITLAIMIIFAGISEYFRLFIIAKGVRDALQSAIISVAVENYDDVYHGVREGYSGAYYPIANNFYESLDYGDIYDRLDNILGLSRSGSYHKKLRSDGSLEFELWNLNIQIKNADFASSDNVSNRFEADATIMISVPVSFGNVLIPPLKIKLKTVAGYIPKF